MLICLLSINLFEKNHNCDGFKLHDGFESRILDLIVSAPDHCLSVYFPLACLKRITIVMDFI